MGELSTMTLSGLLSTTAVHEKLSGILNSESSALAFASTILSVTNGNEALRGCDPMTIVGSAMMAAVLKLSVNPSLGEAYIVPRKNQAQFQIGYRGLQELAMRTGQVSSLICEDVREGQLVRKNKFRDEFVFDEDSKTSDEIIGYMASVTLVNGFKKTIYRTMEEIKAHATKYSDAYRKGWTSPWKTNFDEMAKKTVLKELLKKYVPKSVEMQNAITADQAVLTPKEGWQDKKDAEIADFDIVYADNTKQATDEIVNIEEV